VATYNNSAEEVCNLETQKIGTVEIIRVSRLGSGLYLRLGADLVAAFGLKKGDRLRVEIKEVIKTGEEEGSQR